MQLTVLKLPPGYCRDFSDHKLYCHLLYARQFHYEKSKFLSFFILLVFREVIFPLGRGKFCCVKFENAPGNGFEKYSLGRISLTLLYRGVFNFIPKFTYFALAWIINFSETLIFTYQEG